MTKWFDVIGIGLVIIGMVVMAEIALFPGAAIQVMGIGILVGTLISRILKIA